MKLKAKFAARRDGSFGKVLDYQIDESGIVEVDEADVERLLGTGNFELAGKQKKAEPPKDKTPEGEGDSEDDEGEGATVTADDINAMGKKELTALAADAGVEINDAAPVASLRKTIIKALGL